MAWTDQCKFEAVTAINNTVKTEGISKKKAIAKISKESDIPAGTLNRWYWPRENGVKNDTNKKPVDHKNPDPQESITPKRGNKVGMPPSVVGPANGTVIISKIDVSPEKAISSIRKAKEEIIRCFGSVNQKELTPEHSKRIGNEISHLVTELYEMMGIRVDIRRGTDASEGKALAESVESAESSDE